MLPVTPSRLRAFRNMRMDMRATEGIDEVLIASDPRSSDGSEPFAHCISWTTAM